MNRSTRRGLGGKLKDPIISPNKYEALTADSADSPCRVCQDIVHSDGIICDKCECWVHADSDCSELTPADFNFMQRCKSPAIKYICAACRSEFSDTMLNPHDPIAKNSAKLDHFGAAIAALHDQNQAKLDEFGVAIAALKDQNKVIMDNIKRGNTQDNTVKAQVTEALGDEREKEERKKNAIMYNIPESDPKASTAVSEAEDIQKVTNVVNFVLPNIDSSFLNGKTVIRLGKVRTPSEAYPHPKPRPIKVIFHSPTEVLALRKNARKLKDNQGLNHVGISADKSWNERIQERETRSEFNRRKHDNGEDVVMYKGEIKLRSELPLYAKVAATTPVAPATNA